MEKKIAKSLRALAASMLSECKGETTAWARGYREGARRIREAAALIEEGQIENINLHD